MLKVRHQAKPQNGIVVSEIPAYIKDAMNAEWTFIKENPDHEVVFVGDTRAEVEQDYLLARAYAVSMTPRLETRKATATKKQPETEIRFTLKVYDESATRPGRPAGSTNSKSDK
jgi:hypothetical protein